MSDQTGTYITKGLLIVIMFGDSGSVADVRRLLAKQNTTSDLYSSLGLESLESTLINSLRYLMNSTCEGGSDSSDVEAGIEDEGRRMETSQDNFLVRSEMVLPPPVQGQPERNTNMRTTVGETSSTDGGRVARHEEHDEECQCRQEKTQNEGRHLLQLPIQAMLHIFSFLDAKDISTVGSTCRQCYSLCADQILWRDFLEKDKLLWQQVSHRSNPALFEAVNSDLTYREIYMRCSPEFQQESSGFNLFKLPQLLWSFIPHKPPKVVMFGPGLESNTSSLVRKFLSDDSDIFKVRGVFPAELPGVGTGFKVSMNGKVDMKLITLYSGTRQDREKTPAAGNRAQRNRLLQSSPTRSASPSGEEGFLDGTAYEPTSTIKELCRNVEAFIFVVDASLQLQRTVDAKPELFALMDERWTSSKCPLVILSCVPDSTTSKVPCVTLAKQLDLHKLNRAWKMFDVDVNRLSGAVEAITWLVESAQGR